MHHRRVATTVLLVDDHAGFRRAARAMLEREGYEVVGEVASAASVVGATEVLRPDLVILDIRLPDGDGIDMIPALRRLDPTPEVLLVSTLTADEIGQRLRHLSGVRFLAKADLSPAALREVLSP
jgi:DNA-binding NarL/FixJ family response regulator